MDEEYLKQRNNSNDNANQQTDSTNGATTRTIPATAANTSTVIQTKEEYFDALRVWLQHVQLQQTAMAYFPYYVASNYQQSLNVNGTPIFYPQYPLFPANSNLSGPAAAPNVNAGNQQQTVDQQPPPAPPPIFINNLFQQNRNQYVDNARRNMEGNLFSVTFLISNSNQYSYETKSISLHCIECNVLMQF